MDLPSDTLPIGATLKQQTYQIKSFLGKGGFGITYQGISLDSNSQIAIKEIWPEDGIRQGTTVLWAKTTLKEKYEQIKKFKEEAQYLSRCLHPNIVQVYDWFEENNTAYMVMDFIPSTPLWDIFEEKGPLPEAKIKHYFIQIAAALQTIHNKNLLHRDIKPHNILITPDDKAILIDFGATRQYNASKTGKMTAILTPGFAPNEQYTSYGKPGPGTDIYAMCATMYFLLTGRYPIEAPARYPVDILPSPTSLGLEINQGLEQIILKGMERNIQDRFQSAGELIEAINQVYSPPPARLISQKTNYPIKEFIIDDDRALVGRVDDSPRNIKVDLHSFPNWQTISRNHSIISREGNQWKIKDLNSTNGTFIKRFGHHNFGGKIKDVEVLNCGDEIAFGRIFFLFQTY